MNNTSSNSSHFRFTRLWRIFLSACILWPLIVFADNNERPPETEQQRKTNRAARYIQKGQELEEMGDHRGAIMDYDEAVRLDSEYADAYLYRAKSKLNNGDSDGAEDDADKAIELNPSDDRARYVKAAVKMIKEMYLEAYAEVEKALELDPKNPEYLAMRARIREKLEDFDGAIDDYTKILKRDSHAVEYLILRAQAKIAKGDYKSAIRDLNRIIKSGNPVIESNVVLIPHRRSTEEVILTYKKEMLTIEAMFRRADAYIRMGNVNKALEDYTRIIRANPNHGGPYFVRGLIYYGQQRYEEAQADFYMSVKLTEQDAFEDLDYKYIWIWLVEMQFQDKEASDSILTSYIDKRQDSITDIWTESLFEFLLGKISEKTLFERAHVGKTPKRVAEQYCEAWFYAAQIKLFEANLNQAGRFLRQCINANIRDFLEDKVARLQIETIEEKIGPID